MRPIRWLRRSITVVSAGAAGAAIVVTARHLLETPQPLESMLSGEGRIDRKHGGNVYYNVAGQAEAQPLVLLHDFYPGASNYEYRHVFPRFAVNFRVYAPDWLGFGMSEHPHVAYTGEFYANMLTGFLRDEVRLPASVIATGRAANIAVRAAADNPDLFESLVLVSPYALAGIELEPTLRQTLARAAQRTSLGLVPYALLATRPILRRQQSWRTAHADDPTTREAAIQHLYASAHQFGGHHALLALLTGELDLPIQNNLALMEPPALIISGADDPLHPREEMEDLAILSPHADLEVIPGAGAAVMEDQPAAFAEVVTRWLHGERGRHVLSDEALLPRLEQSTRQEPPTQETFTQEAAPPEPPIEVKPASAPELMEQPPSPPPAATPVEREQPMSDLSASEPPTGAAELSAEPAAPSSARPEAPPEAEPATEPAAPSVAPSAREDTVLRTEPTPSEPAAEELPTGAQPAASEPATPPRTPPKTPPRANRSAPSQSHQDAPHTAPGRPSSGRTNRPPERRGQSGEPRNASGRDGGHSGGNRRPREHRNGHTSH